MGVMDAIKKGFGIATKNIGLVVVLFAFNLIWSIASIPLMKAPGTTPEPGAMAGLFSLSLLFILISIFMQGGSLGMVRDFIKDGKAKLSSIPAYGLKYYLRLFGLGVIMLLLIVIVALVAVLIITLASLLKNVAITIVAAVLAIIFGLIGIYFVILLIFAPYFIICNESGVIASMKQSMAMTRKSIAKVILLLLAIVLISLGVGFIIGLLGGYLMVAVPQIAAQVVMAVVNSIFNGYFGVVMMASFMVFYFALGVKENASPEKVIS